MSCTKGWLARIGELRGMKMCKQIPAISRDELPHGYQSLRPSFADPIWA
jgi:hypothetical protein